MSEYKESFRDKAAPYVAGFGLYWIIYWVFAFYPAFILSMIFQRVFFGIDSEEVGAIILGIFIMVLFTFIILGLIKCKQYFIVLMFYVLTAWPFLYILNHCCHAEEWRDGVWIDTYPLPLDLWPLW